MERPIKMGDLGVPLFSETSIKKQHQSWLVKFISSKSTATIRLSNWREMQSEHHLNRGYVSSKQMGYVNPEELE